METESLLTEFEISLLRGLQAAQMQRSTRCTSDNTELQMTRGRHCSQGVQGQHSATYNCVRPSGVGGERRPMGPEVTWRPHPGYDTSHLVKDTKNALMGVLSFPEDVDPGHVRSLGLTHIFWQRNHQIVKVRDSDPDQLG